MAQPHLDDRGSWLNSRPLSQDMDFLEKQLPLEFPYADSVVSSNMDFLEKQLPLEFPYADSVVSSTETDSDEESYISDLTHRIACSTLQDDVGGGNGFPELKVGSMAGSPQSTLCSLGSLSGRSVESGGSGNSSGPSLFSSPPSTPPLSGVDDFWELMYPAAGQVMRMKTNDEAGHKTNKPLSIPAVETKTSTIAGHCLSRCWSENDRDYSALVAHFEYLKQQQHLRSLARQVRSTEAHRARSIAPMGSNARPVRGSFVASRNPSPNNGMRAIFLGNSTSKKQSSGTGVFLPRTGNGPVDGFRKKSGCSTVLLPARVVQALNLNIDNTGSHPSYYQGTLIPGQDITLQPQPLARNSVLSSQRRIISPQQTVLSNELRLPQEWTY